MLTEAIIAIKGTPTVDAEKVVRCKDCKYHKGTSINMKEHCCLSGMTVDSDGFCSYGERRADNA